MSYGIRAEPHRDDPTRKENDMLTPAPRRAWVATKRRLRTVAPPGTARHRAGTAVRRYALHLASGWRADARLLLAAAGADLAAGQLPRRLPEAVRAATERADTRLRGGDAPGAAVWLARAGSMAFHRVVHFDRLSSPLAESPTEFLAPLHDSDAVRVLNARARREPAAPAPSGRPLRLLIATRGNANFLSEIRRHYEAHGRVDVRYLDLAADPARAHLTRDSTRMIAHILAGDSAYGRAVEDWLRPHLDWADTVFVDWCAAPAVMFTMIDPGPTRIVVRLHSFELFTIWPQLVGFARVDDLVFVSEHMRSLAVAALPQLSAATAPRTCVIPNAMRLRGFARPKPPEARFTLGLVGYDAVAKDARWAVEVLRLLRSRDDRYRLRIVGGAPDLGLSAAARAYHQRLGHDLVELERQGAVSRTGRTEDVPAALTGIGVIVSSSVRESFHCALVEGAASGAVPVVRDWPFFAGHGGGARALFPSDWVVNSPAEAAELIIEQTATEERWRRAGAAASSHAIATWDWPVTRSLLDDLLIGAATADG
ncbi:glycosyltransferase [Micromonospora sp. CPCC 206061]|uniref:glycosyltransferase n=1 Tax=Micromonospora sp. CPCC 206061 TaxID=3122410 RepID=UPI002FEE8E95